MSTTIVWLRLFLIAISVSAAVLIVVLNHPMRHHVSFGHMMTRAGTVVVLLAVAYRTVESLFIRAPGGPGLWMLAAGLVWLNVGCVASLVERRKIKQHRESGSR